MNYNNNNKEAKSLTLRRRSEVSQETLNVLRKLHELHAELQQGLCWLELVGTQVQKSYDRGLNNYQYYLGVLLVGC